MDILENVLSRMTGKSKVILKKHISVKKGNEVAYT
jgi:hypothetical protein